MTTAEQSQLYASWEELDREYRDPADAIAAWQDPGRTRPEVLEFETYGAWWDVLRQLRVVLIVTLEYEHLLIALRCDERTGPDVSLMRVPHPSGVAVDVERGSIFVACTRNPNQVYEFRPVRGLMPRLDVDDSSLDGLPLVPVQIRVLPGCCYLHDLAFVGGVLHATAVGWNSVVRLPDRGAPEPVWWPECVETDDGPIFGRNHLQLNSIAAGPTIADSFFSASTDQITELRPGDPEFPVDRRGVIFSGTTREPIARGLTRPHSARMHRGAVWVDNSGYGEVGRIDRGVFQPVVRLPGWTRGLAICGDTAFVGTSRVLPRFRGYAPGLDLDASRCGVHAVDLASGNVLGGIQWPLGSQIFAVEAVPAEFTSGFAFRQGEEHDERLRTLFYAFQSPDSRYE